ncbi:MAG: ATP-binding protein [Candidatus Hydrogenedentota bacterium]
MKPRPNGKSVSDQIVQALTAGVIAVDADGCVVSINPAALHHLGIPESALSPGARIGEVRGLEELRDLLDELSETGQPVSRREIVVDGPQGTTKDIGISASLIDGPNAYNGAILLFADLTERKQLELAAEINRQLASIGELAAGVVHELRNPLTIITGRAELLLRAAQDDSFKKSAASILSEAKHLDASISQFLRFARPFTLAPTKCRAEEVARRAVDLCKKLAEDRHVRLECAVATDAGECVADPQRLSEALSNLIRNAIEAVEPRSGVVTVLIEELDSAAAFHVTDNGPGVMLGPGEDIFSPFFTKKHDGTGLGLSLVSRIVSAHGGAVSWENNPDAGARFTIRVPKRS